MSEVYLSKNIVDNLDLIAKNIPLNSNFIIREIILNPDIRCSILYINGLANQSYIEESIIHPLLFRIREPLNNSEELCSYLSRKYICSYDTTISNNVNTICHALKHGKSIVLLEHNASVIICNTTGGSYRSISESNIETDIRGGKEAFVENLEINLAVIQQKLKNNHFKIETMTLGELSQTDVALLYIDNIIDKDILSEIRIKLSAIKAPYIPDSGYISQYIQNSNFQIFPQTKTTELPDKVISDLLQGKAVIMTNGSPQVIILPVVFIEFFQTLEDYSNKFFNANFDRVVRFVGAFIVLIIAPIYLVLLEYNAELIPLNLMKIIISSRMGIPLTPFLEILSMEILIEFLREGGIRLPSPIGQTLGIVGGIVLGDAATKAGLVSPTTLVVIAIEVISTFVIPNYEMSLTIRLLRFPLLILAELFGFLGIVFGTYFIFSNLCSLDSFGIPYLSPIAPLRGSALRDSIIRLPLKHLNSITNIFKSTMNKVKKHE
jgi:spore germination protein KA